MLCVGVGGGGGCYLGFGGEELRIRERIIHFFGEDWWKGVCVWGGGGEGR